MLRRPWRNLMEPSRPTEDDDTQTEVLDFNKPIYQFVPGEHHDWQQQGPYLMCKSCELQHGQWIGTEKVMVGLNEKGMPIFEERFKSL